MTDNPYESTSEPPCKRPEGRDSNCMIGGMLLGIVFTCVLFEIAAIAMNTITGTKYNWVLYLSMATAIFCLLVTIWYPGPKESA